MPDIVSGMRRRVFDTLMSTAGMLIAALLLVAGGLLLWAHSFVESNVHDQLAAQKIFFPEAGSDELTGNAEIEEYVTPYAGQQVTDGRQAEIFADHYIAVHLREMADGQTYSEVSGRFLTMDPSDPDYQQVAQTRQALFMGESLRGLLLDAYAFWKMGQIALWAALAAFVGAGLMLILSALGFRHRRHVPEDAEVFAGHPEERRPALT